MPTAIAASRIRPSTCGRRRRARSRSPRAATPTARAARATTRTDARTRRTGRGAGRSRRRRRPGPAGAGGAECGVPGSNLPRAAARSISSATCARQARRTSRARRPMSRNPTGRAQPRAPAASADVANESSCATTCRRKCPHCLQRVCVRTRLRPEPGKRRLLAVQTVVNARVQESAYDTTRRHERHATEGDRRVERPEGRAGSGG